MKSRLTTSSWVASLARRSSFPLASVTHEFQVGRRVERPRPRPRTRIFWPFASSRRKKSRSPRLPSTPHSMPGTLAGVACSNVSFGSCSTVTSASAASSGSQAEPSSPGRRRAAKNGPAGRSAGMSRPSAASDSGKRRSARLPGRTVVGSAVRAAGELPMRRTYMPVLRAVVAGIAHLDGVRSRVREDMLEAAIEVQAGVVVALRNEAAAGVADRHERIGVRAEAIGDRLEADALPGGHVDGEAIHLRLAERAPQRRRQRRLAPGLCRPVGAGRTGRSSIRNRWALLSPPTVATRTPQTPTGASAATVTSKTACPSSPPATGVAWTLPAGKRGPQIERLVQVGADEGHARGLAALGHGRSDVFDERLGRTRRYGQGRKEQHGDKGRSNESRHDFLVMDGRPRGGTAGAV